MFVEGERYWESTPWKDVPVEEFNSHQWQVSAPSSLGLLSMLICVDCEDCREQTQAI